MKKKNLPKYIHEKFSKPQFNIGDKVKYEFLGNSGWGIILSIHKHDNKISYMVKGHSRSYPCGLKIKEHRSYYAGTIFFEESDAYRKNSKDTGGKKTSSRNNNTDSKQVPNDNGSRVSNKSRGSVKKSNTRNGNSTNSTGSAKSGKRIDNAELGNAISKQKDFLRKFN